MTINFEFDQVWEDGRYAEWVRRLKHKSGVYVIRSSTTDEVFYVGESHEDKLYQTLTRHFQAWNDRYEIDPAGGRHGGPTYDRHRVEVAVHVCAGSVAVARQYDVIRELRPRDNLVGNLEEDDDEDDVLEHEDEILDDGDEDEDGEIPF